MIEACKAPSIVSATLHDAFEHKARRMGLDPANRWIGGYVDYEWHHLRHIIETLPVRLEGMHVLEFGCNVGASAILFAALGARVTAIDIAPDVVELARLNAHRYGLDAIDFLHVGDTRRLPFADGAFQLVSCNSVLEYVPASMLSAVQREIDRVLAPDGTILVTGTSNRMSPREVHSHRWLVNYLPRSLDPAGKHVQRGIWPAAARFGFGRHYDNLDHAGDDGLFARSRRAMGMPPAKVAILQAAARLLGTSPGLLSPSIFCVLRKRA
ncbi:class I SAM-dependent methyltransferase [Massilia phosphatilytica]|jgi:ubiquinone/menaquinone biosynthesis C-methylase UbiE|nr:class I SAM-dependent methyltransferase [Massilia phosphatilytica]